MRDDLAAWLDGPTIRRGDSLTGFSAAVPLRSLPHLLSWSPDAPPAPPPLRRQAETRDPVVGDDDSRIPLAPRQGVPTTIRLPERADWLWGLRRSGPSPWYAALELASA